ncbi:MAG: hypothetical protein JWM80_2235 [Cyanobacteria bacterium RYN_339]|nr:hypothetical protein [Cyanobacteria bacterium RYN_339]
MTTTVELYREIDDLQERMEEDALWEKWESFGDGWRSFGPEGDRDEGY